MTFDISMDGKGCWRDNVFVERLWKSFKYEEVYLHTYDGMTVARRRIEYNLRRHHPALDNQTPDEFYVQHLPELHCAA